MQLQPTIRSVRVNHSTTDTGQEMSGTEFEKAAGREKAKKWKTSVRVMAEGGKQGEMVGDWLQVGCCVLLSIGPVCIQIRCLLCTM